MIELRKEEYGRITEMVKEIENLHIFVLSVIEDIQPGRVFVDNGTNPNSCLVLSESGKYLVAGNCNNKDFNDLVVNYLSDERNHRKYFDLYFSNHTWFQIIYSRLKGRVIRLARSSYIHHVTNANNAGLTTDDKVDLVETDKYLFTKICDEVDPSYRHLWESSGKFINSGFGYCLLTEGNVASTCNTFYCGSNYAEIDIVTLQKYRNRGYAKATCTAFIERCKKTGLTPVWDCDAGNVPSNRLALKLGFEKLGTYEMLWWHENEEVIQSYLKKYNYSNS
jgi:GNAT superfamily N-acetyltransferase